VSHYFVKLAIVIKRREAFENCNAYRIKAVTFSTALFVDYLSLSDYKATMHY